MVTLLKPMQFDPAANERVIRIATGDTVALAISRGLIDRLERYAPRTTVQFVNIRGTTRRDLDEGQIDFLVVPRGMIPPEILSEEGLDRMALYRVDSVCIARRDHPDIGDSLTVELINALPVVSCRVDELSYLHATLPGRRRSDRIQVPQFISLPMIVAESNAIAMMQRHIAEWFARILPIRILELPIPFPEVEMCAYWSAFQRKDPMHIWMREQVKEIVEEGNGVWLPLLRENGF